MKRLLAIAAGGLVAAGAFAQVARAQDEPEKAWTNVADLSLVTTGGNSQVTTWAISDKFVYDWSRSQLIFEGSALKSDTRVRDVSNVAGEAVVDENTATTAEEYFVGGRYRYSFAANLFTYTSGRWYRNEFSGIDNRLSAAFGLGYRILAQEKQTFSLEVGADWTNEEQVASQSNTFGGVQAVFDYQYKFSESAVFDGDLAFLENLKDTEDLRINLVLALTASMTKTFAISLRYTVLFDNQPVQVLVPSDAPGVPDATFTFDKTDTRFAASLVINL